MAISGSSGISNAERLNCKKCKSHSDVIEAYLIRANRAVRHLDLQFIVERPSAYLQVDSIFKSFILVCELI